MGGLPSIGKRPAAAILALLILSAAGATSRGVKPVILVDPPSNINVLAHIEPASAAAEVDVDAVPHCVSASGRTDRHGEAGALTRPARILYRSSPR